LDKLIANYEALEKMDAQKKAVLEQLRTNEIRLDDTRDSVLLETGAES